MRTLSPGHCPCNHSPVPNSGCASNSGQLQAPSWLPPLSDGPHHWRLPHGALVSSGGTLHPSHAGSVLLLIQKAGRAFHRFRGLSPSPHLERAHGTGDLGRAGRR